MTREQLEDTVAPADNNINIISPTPDSWTNSTSASATLTFEDPNPNGVTISGMDRVYSGFFKSNQPSPTVGDMEKTILISLIVQQILAQ